MRSRSSQSLASSRSLIRNALPYADFVSNTEAAFATQSNCGRLCRTAPDRARACKNLQEIPEQASTIGIERRSGGRADPDFPGSAAFDRQWLLPVTPEAAGSSPVDPANYPQFNRFH